MNRSLDGEPVDGKFEDVTDTVLLESDADEETDDEEKAATDSDTVV